MLLLDQQLSCRSACRPALRCRAHRPAALAPLPSCSALGSNRRSYAETVIHRIFYANNRLGDGRISWREFRRCAGLPWLLPRVLLAVAACGCCTVDSWHAL